MKQYQKYYSAKQGRLPVYIADLLDICLLVSSIGNTFSGRKLSRWRVEIFRQGKVGKTANPAQPENTTRP
jgi:hypothetical protein